MWLAHVTFHELASLLRGTSTGWHATMSVVNCRDWSWVPIHRGCMPSLFRLSGLAWLASHLTFTYRSGWQPLAVEHIRARYTGTAPQWPCGLQRLVIHLFALWVGHRATVAAIKFTLIEYHLLATDHDVVPHRRHVPQVHKHMLPAAVLLLANYQNCDFFHEKLNRNRSRVRK